MTEYLLQKTIADKNNNKKNELINKLANGKPLTKQSTEHMKHRKVGALYLMEVIYSTTCDQEKNCMHQLTWH